MRFKELLIFLSIIFVDSISARAETTLFDDSKGLTSNEITEIVKDNMGKIWVGTTMGLNIFDGYSFEEVNKLKGLNIRSITYDSVNNEFWVVGETTLFLIQGSNKQVIKWCYYEKNNLLNVILYKGKRYLLYQKGYIIELDQAYHSKGIVMPHAFRKRIQQVAFDQDETIFFTLSDHTGIFAMNIETWTTQVVSEVLEDDVWKIVPGTGHVWVVGEGYKHLKVSVAKSGKTINSKIIEINKRLSLIPMGDGRIGASFKDYFGFQEFFDDGRLGSLLSIDDEAILKGKDVKCILSDIGGVIWVGTRNGLVKFTNETTFPFQNLLQSGNRPISVRGFTQVDQEHCYVATYSGIYEYNLQSNRFKSLLSKLDVSKPTYARVLHYNKNANRLIIGTESHKYFLFRFLIDESRFEYGFYQNNDSAKIGAIYSMLEDKTGLVWLATDKGLARYDDRIGYLELYKEGPFNVGENRLYYVSKSTINDHLFWIAGRENVFLVDTKTGIKKVLNINSQPKLSDDDYIFIHEQPNHTVWIGSKKSGLLKLDAGHKHVTSYTKSEGLPTNEVYGLLWQNDSIAWVSTANGLSRFDLQDSSFFTFYQKNGISDNEFNQHSLFKAPNGFFYFGSINGITSFKPSSIQLNLQPNYIYVSAISKWNKKDKSYINIEHSNRIKLSADDYALTLNLGLSDYSNIPENQFYYRIKGLNENWVSLGSLNTLRLESLSAGIYNLEVMGMNKHGQRSINTLHFTVEIDQIFYKTVWFYIVLSVFVGLILYGYFKWRIRAIHKRQELRTQIASNLHDEVGSLLTHIVISSDNARYTAKTLEEKNKRMESISTLARLATQTMSDVLWSIDARNDFAGNLTDRIREQAESMFQALDIEIWFDFSLTKQHIEIAPKTRQQLYFIYKEALNNIAKHSKARNVWITYKQEGVHSFQLMVKNDGYVAHDEAHKNMGQGLKNMKMRSTSIGATFNQHVKGDEYTIIVSK